MIDNQLLRSLMFVPAHNLRLMESACKTEADVLLLDIEDSVQPIENKPIARENILSFIEKKKFNGQLIFPRINDRESGQLLKDITTLAVEGVHGFMYPKAQTGEDIYFISKLLETIEYEKGFEIGKFKIIALIETAGAVLNAQDICKASDRVIAIAFGCEDFVSDIQGSHDPEGLSIFTPRAMISMAARANNVIPIDTVHIKVHDLDDLEKNLQLSKKLGFDGMLVLHPKEIPLVNKYYSPTNEEISEAEEMLVMYKKAQKEGKGVAIMNNKFIGPPMVIQANNILTKAKSIKNKA